MDSNLKTLMALVPALPMAAAVIVAALGPRLLRKQSHWLVVIALAASCLVSVTLLRHVQQQPVGYEHVESYWTWVLVDGASPQTVETPQSSGAQVAPPVDFRIDIALRLDALTAIMLTMVTFISTLVAIYSAGYMHGDRGYWRFFAYIALFVFSMTMLVSVSNFLLLFVFWEAVGVCSYLLIGFWYEKPAAAAAGMKAFLVNRIGDFGFMLGVFLIWTTYGTLNYHDTETPAAGAPIAVETGSVADAGTSDVAPAKGVDGVLGARRIATQAFVGGGTGLAICLLLMLGACGKSAQFPLHVWLPDAMEGPTPVSALIHAATMVTAGVYMVTRCTPLFIVSPEAQWVVASIGTFTALLAGLIALTQYDLKRVLAYSTVSQLGYMFLGLGTGTLAGISAGMFHLFTHAFFKALLFLGAGSVMHAMGNVIDMRRFGGLRKIMPVTCWTFLIGCLALSGIAPFSGFWSKDAILASVHAKAHSLEHELEQRHATVQADTTVQADATHVQFVSMKSATADSPHVSGASGMSELQLERGARLYKLLYYVSLFVAFLTSVYTFRMLYLTFFGEERVPAEAGHHAHESPRVMTWPLVVLAVFAAGVGLWLDRSYLNGTHPFAGLLASTPSLTGAVAQTEKLGEFHASVAATSLIIAVAGLLLATYLYVFRRSALPRWQAWMELRPFHQLTNGEHIVRLRQRPGWRSVGAALRSVGLGWLGRLLVDIVRLVALALLAPVMLSRFISPYRLSYGKFYFDEVYQTLLVGPTRLVARLLALWDDWVIDGLVNTVGRVPLWLGGRLRAMQTGLVQFYALAMVLGVLALLLAMDQQFGASVAAWLQTMWGGSGQP